MQHYIITQGYYDEYSEIIDQYENIGVGSIVTQDEENRLELVEEQQRGGGGNPPPNPPTGPKG